MKANILALDIETSPLVSYNWGLYEQNAIKRIKTFTILSVAYQWLGGELQVLSSETPQQETKISPKIISNILRESKFDLGEFYSRIGKIISDTQLKQEKKLLLKLREILDKADIVIAHNGDSFDVKKINTRMIIHKIPPYSPFKTVDTKKVAKSVAAFDSNSLNNLGIDMDEGEKIKHRGFDMWEGCMGGKRRDWADMKRYNKKDVDLLVRIYNRLRPWIRNHPHTGLMAGNPGACANCASLNVKPKGTRFTKTRVIQRWLCGDCGAWS